MTGADDAERVAELLGRAPMGPYEIVHRRADGDPVVIRNGPFLDDGTPMPTRYWLIGDVESRAVAALEATGGVRRAEAEIPAESIAASHAAHAAERDAQIPDDHTGPRPTGGIGGTRTGVKCLHAHYAWFLAGGDDPVGRWVHEQIGAVVPPGPDAERDASGEVRLELGDDRITIGSRRRLDLPVGVATLRRDHLDRRDPPDPADLTNAIALIADTVDDLAREFPGDVPTGGVLRVASPAGTALARLETGRADTSTAEVDRATLEEVFRLIATETAADRRAQPGVGDCDPDDLLAHCSAVVAVARRLQPSTIVLGDAP
jgi:hypothetical protein